VQSLFEKFMAHTQNPVLRKIEDREIKDWRTEKKREIIRPIN